MFLFETILGFCNYPLFRILPNINLNPIKLIF